MSAADEPLKKIRRVFGRGYATGFTDGLIHGAKPMTPARQQALEQSLNGYARKVLAAVPISEPWDMTQIIGEMKRVGNNVDQRVLTGCLSALVDQGLVREVTRGSFIRVVARTPVLTTVPPQVLPEKDIPMPTPTVDPIKRLEEIVARLKALSSEVEDIAIEITLQAQKTSSENAKLLQLKALLKEL